MSKYRKSSLSPCWTALTSNKENINFENVVSFKSIVNAKKQHSRRQQISPHNVDAYASIYTPVDRQLHFEEVVSSTTTKGSRKRIDTRESGMNGQTGGEEEGGGAGRAARSDLEVRDILKSKDKQISSLHSQVKVLENTIDLLKSQVDVLTKEARNPSQSSKADPKADVERLTRQNMALRKELQGYSEIVPKLNELEVIQNALIEENREMKGREEKMKAVFREMRGLLGSESGRVGQLLAAFFN